MRLRTFLPDVILIILLQLWSLKSDYQIGEPHKWHSWSSVCVWNVNCAKWKLIWRTLFPLTKTQKRNWANTHYQAIMTSRLVNNTYIWQNYEQYVRPLFKEIKKWWHLPRSICIKEQAPLLNSTFRQTLIFLLFSKCANGSVYSGLCEAVRTALKWSVLVEIDRHPIQSSLFNTENKGTEPSVRFTEVSEKVWFLVFLGANELSVIERCP